MDLKPNHICKNPNCKRSENNTRAIYFACDYCDKVLNWHSMACCKECYNEYIKLIELSRGGANLYPERVDMSDDEIVDLVKNTPINEVKAKTLKDLSDYSDEIESHGIEFVVDSINKEIKKPRKPRAKKQ